MSVGVLERVDGGRSFSSFSSSSSSSSSSFSFLSFPLYFSFPASLQVIIVRGRRVLSPASSPSLHPLALPPSPSPPSLPPSLPPFSFSAHPNRTWTKDKIPPRRWRTQRIRARAPPPACVYMYVCAGEGGREEGREGGRGGWDLPRWKPKAAGGGRMAGLAWLVLLLLFKTCVCTWYRESGRKCKVGVSADINTAAACSPCFGLSRIHGGSDFLIFCLIAMSLHSPRTLTLHPYPTYYYREA